MKMAKGGSGSIIQLALLGGAAYLLYKNWDSLAGSFGLSPVVSGGSTPIPGTGAGGGSAGTPTQQTQTQTSATTPAGTVPTESLQSRLVKAAGKSDGLNFDQWNYYLAQVTGRAGPSPEEIIPGTSPENVAQYRALPQSVSSYLVNIAAWLQTQGISGLGGGLGNLAALDQLLDLRSFLVAQDRGRF